MSAFAMALHVCIRHYPAMRDPKRNRLKELRNAAGLSMDQLALKVKPATSASQINKLEKGIVKMTLHWQYRLAEALQVHPIEIVEELPPRLSTREEELVERYRALREADQDAVFRFADAMAQPAHGRHHDG